MPTPVTKAPATETPSVAGLPLEPKPFGQYWISPAETTIRRGEAVPYPALVRPNWGVLGTPGSGSEPSSDTSDTYQRRLGRIPVPLDFKVKAWGEEYDGYMVSTECRPDAHGKRRIRWHDIWTRYSVIGAQVIEEIDYEGLEDFMFRCRDLLGGTIPQAIETATFARTRQLADAMAMAGSPLGQREAARIEANLTKPAGRKTKTPA